MCLPSFSVDSGILDQNRDQDTRLPRLLSSIHHLSFPLEEIENLGRYCRIKTPLWHRERLETNEVKSSQETKN
jgi:hypothetical protein